MIGTNQLLFTDGTNTAPVLSFQTLTTLGIWRNTVASTHAGAGLAISSGSQQIIQYSAIGTHQIIGDYNQEVGGIYTNANGSAGHIQTIGGSKIINGNPGVVAGDGIVRASLVTANSWEDGFMGNANSINFTPTDFHASDPLISVTIENQFGAGSTPSGIYGVTTTAIGDTFAGITAMKIIPKGFQISATNKVTVYTASGARANTTIRVSAQKVNFTTLPGIIIYVNAAYTTNTPQSLTGIPTYIGDGDSMIVIHFENKQLSWAIGNAVTGATITMERV